MICAELEQLICDYVDGTLTAARKAEVERHLEECPACAELARDSAAAVSFMERAADVEPPPELITRILYDAPWTKKAPAKARGWLGERLSRLMAPVMQPRFVMGMAMTILSFSILSRFVPMQQIKASDLRPSEDLGRTGRPGAPRLGPQREVLRKPESGVPGSDACCGTGSSRPMSRRRQAGGT